MVAIGCTKLGDIASGAKAVVVAGLRDWGLLCHGGDCARSVMAKQENRTNIKIQLSNSGKELSNKLDDL